MATATITTTAMERRIMTRTQLAKRIARGETLVLHRRKVYKLDRWLERHPGGQLAILHFVGRDATDEIEAYHSQDTLDRLMSRFVIAHLDQKDWDHYRPLVPPVQLGYRGGKLDHPHAQMSMWKGDRPDTFPLPVDMLEPPSPPSQIDPVKEAKVSQAWKEMHSQVKQAGLYTLRPSGYLREGFRYLLLGFLAYYFLLEGHGKSSTTSFLLSSLFLGLFWHQLTFTAHDAGHSGITHSHSLDHLIGTTIADLIGGLSIGWWCDSHDVHHLVTNHPEHDPDIQHMPFFAISPSFVTATDPAEGLWSSYYRRILTFDKPSKFFLRHQHKLYYLVMAFGRFNLYANSYGFLAFKARRNRWLFIEVFCLSLFWTWYGQLLYNLPSLSIRLGYLLISHIVTSPLHVQIVLSHFAQSSTDVGLFESFASRQVRTTMDVECPTFLDFIHGGLHMQVTHHLFPRLPRHNLREARDRFVKPFCEKWGLDYAEYSFIDGNGRVLDTLRKVAGQVEVLAKVAQAQAKGELH